MRAGIVAGVLLILLGIGGLAYAATHRGTVRSYVQSHYACTPQRGGRRIVCRAGTDPVTTANRINRSFRAASRRVVPAGVFLRYRHDMVAVTPSGRGSSIVVENDRDAYRSNYNYIGGYWGGYSRRDPFPGRPGGAGETFRGGGPGTGK